MTSFFKIKRAAFIAYFAFVGLKQSGLLSDRIPYYMDSIYSLHKYCAHRKQIAYCFSMAGYENVNTCETLKILFLKVC